MDAIDLERKYNTLVSKVRLMLSAQKEYFRSNKDYNKLKLSKALEKEVDELVNPKGPVQSTIDWLAQ